MTKLFIIIIIIKNRIGSHTDLYDTTFVRLDEAVYSAQFTGLHIRRLSSHRITRMSFDGFSFSLYSLFNEDITDINEYSKSHMQKCSFTWACSITLFVSKLLSHRYALRCQLITRNSIKKFVEKVCSIHQMTHFWSSVRWYFCPGWHLKALWNSRKFDKTPSSLIFPGQWLSSRENFSPVAVIVSHHKFPKDRKNSCSWVYDSKPVDWRLSKHKQFTELRFNTWQLQLLSSRLDVVIVGIISLS